MAASIASGRSLGFIAAMVALLAASALILTSTGWDARRLAERLNDGGPWTPIVFVFFGIILMSTCVPKTVMSISAGALFGTLGGSGLMLMIAVMAAAMNYGIGRWWLADSLRQRISDRAAADQDRHRPGGQGVLGIAHAMAQDAGFGFHFLIRLSPVPTMLISYTMGVCGARLGPYLAAAAVAVIPQALWVHGGTAASMTDAPPASQLRWIGIAISVAGAIALSIVVPREAVRRLKASHLGMNSEVTD